MFLFSFCSCFSTYAYLLATADGGKVGVKRNGAEKEMIPKKLFGWVLISLLIMTFLFVLFMRDDVLEFPFKKIKFILCI